MTNDNNSIMKEAVSSYIYESSRTATPISAKKWFKDNYADLFSFNDPVSVWLFILDGTAFPIECDVRRVELPRSSAISCNVVVIDFEVSASGVSHD